MTPVLYTFRRCPYAIRARMALNYADVQVQTREVLLSDKPSAMLQASAKGTVPVLVLADGRVIDESIDVMRWALQKRDTDNWWREELAVEAEHLYVQNDDVFKLQLDRYKYSDRYPEFSELHYRTEAETFLQDLEQRLAHKRYLLGDELSFTDVAIFPFVRQFAYVDMPWFEQSPYRAVRRWLKSFLESVLFTDVMVKTAVWKPLS